MATNLPDKLKKADLHRFALRAAQLEKARPIVTYWCEYYILQHVLNRQLHAGDDETSNYAVQLMDKLEATKAANAANDAFTDDVAAKAYIENFALDTFNRADESQRTNKVTKQTADTFMAAATFMDVCSIWGESDPEILAKSKFAKYHARRILQAIKAGEDPNASNPVVEELSQPPVDEVEAELQELESQQNGDAESSHAQPSVATEGNLLPHVSEQEPSLPKVSPVPPGGPQQTEYAVSPLDPAETPNSRQNSIGGGYFPNTSSAPTDVDMVDRPLPSAPPEPSSDMNPQDFYNTSAPPPETQPSAPSPEALGITSPARPSAPTPNQMAAQPPTVQPVSSPPPQVPVRAQQPTYVAAAARAPVPAPAPVPPPQQVVAPTMTGFRTDDEATMAAQKHARWAISALNFEDVNTAVKELRLALQALGAG